MSRKLKYFDVPGYTESIRYILYYGGVEFEDVRIAPKDWPIKEVKDALPYGQMPIYEENGRVLNQSIAIARYVASQVGLLPSDPWEQAQLDAAVHNIYDFLKKMGSFSNEDPEKKEQLQEETLEYFFSRFERELIAGNGYFGGKLSWADFIMAGAIACLKAYPLEGLDAIYPNIFALVSVITSSPGVKEYIESRK